MFSTPQKNTRARPLTSSNPKEFIAMIEGKISGEHAYIARTYMDCPGVDSNIFVMTDEELMTGDFVKVKVTGTNDYDLIGELI